MGSAAKRRPAMLGFGELAAARTLPVFESVTAHLGALTRAVMPHDRDFKLLRKELLRLRDHLDLFTFAYATPTGDVRRWRALRDRLNHGYEVFGDFKDLFDSQRAELGPKDAPEYEAAQVRALRRAVLAWAASFRRPGQLAAWRELLTTPSTRVEPVARKDLTRLFWRSVDFRPRDADSGLTTVARFSSAMAKNAARAVKKSRGGITTPKGARAFHDTRKRLRNAVNLLENFAEVQPAHSGASLAIVHEAVKRYGSLADQLVARRMAKERRKKKHVAGLARSLKTDWKRVRAWQVEVRLARVLTTLARSLRTTSSRACSNRPLRTPRPR